MAGTMTVNGESKSTCKQPGVWF